MQVTISQKKQQNFLAFSSDVHPLLQIIFQRRLVETEEDLDLSLTKLLTFHCLKDIDLACQLLGDCIINKHKILIIGDFDCDGATSCALAVDCLQKMGAEVNFLASNRFTYGYGLSTDIVSAALSQNPYLIVTVDNGISSVEGVAKAKNAGVKVLITDHHLPPKILPEADAIVNPNQIDCPFQGKNTAGVGVIFYVMCALRAYLKETYVNVELPNMAQYLDLVALGTVADVVKLDHNNRILVEQGLKRIRAGMARIGIKSLMRIANVNEQTLIASDIGFSIAPRLNAAGRLDDISIGIKLLLSQDMTICMQYGKILNNLNIERKDIEKNMLQEAENLLSTFSSTQQASNSLEKHNAIGLCLYHSSWHQGVIGILASRIKNLTAKPTIIFSNDKLVDQDMIIKGSARSVNGLNIRDVLSDISVLQPELLISYGGHAMAAGVTLFQKDFSVFTKQFNFVVSQYLTPSDIKRNFEVDGKLDSSFFNLKTANLLRYAGPWGQGFPEPIFYNTFIVEDYICVKGKHLKLYLKIPNQDFLMEAIAFNQYSSLQDIDLNKPVNCVFKLESNIFKNTEQLQLNVLQLIQKGE